MILVHLKLLPLIDLQPILDIKPMFVLKPFIQCHLINTLYTVRSLTDFEVKWLGLLIFILYSIVVVLEHINLVLLSCTRLCQPSIIKENHKTGGDNARA